MLASIHIGIHKSTALQSAVLGPPFQLMTYGSFPMIDFWVNRSVFAIVAGFPASRRAVKYACRISYSLLSVGADRSKKLLGF